MPCAAAAPVAWAAVDDDGALVAPADDAPAAPPALLAVVVELPFAAAELDAPLLPPAAVVVTSVTVLFEPEPEPEPLPALLVATGACGWPSEICDTTPFWASAVAVRARSAARMVKRIFGFGFGSLRKVMRDGVVPALGLLEIWGAERMSIEMNAMRRQRRKWCKVKLFDLGSRRKDEMEDRTTEAGCGRSNRTGNGMANGQFLALLNC